ncbi:hypothetical protein TRICHSKD4_1834 [Roseibium sp. TrichSKD4]|uniref:hypothetical protein n=1 Tax=Roseibium sp. TrichSKD4 TaxID=744980 RepID=UPI0001E56C98|nr:hypothetical protein [Roseibium sp. TrichSKD4]EFO33208.1 hypothetical protein TRICHSKD4_1834 [Roseibium sp. TrichSKD4]
MSRLIPRDFNLVVNETLDLYGTLQTTTPGGIEPVRKEFHAGGSILNANPITGFKFKAFKFKVVTYPNGFDELPIGEPIALSWSEYMVDEDDPTNEIGIRHYYEGELDPAKEADRKREDLVEWDYEVTNLRRYRKYKNDKLIDEGDLKKNSLILNGKQIWANRNRFLQRG